MCYNSYGDVMADMFEKRNNREYILNTGCWVNSTFIERNTEEHTHDFVELTYITHGSGVHIINGRKYPVKKGDLLFLNYNCTHAIECAARLEYTDIMFKLDYIDANLKNSGNAFSLLGRGNFKEFESMIYENNCKIHFYSDERQEFEQLIKRVITEQDNPKPGSDFLISAILNQILIFVFRKMEFNLNDRFFINDEMLLFIKNNCTSQLKLRDIAVEKHYSASYIGALFKEYTGMSFTEYIMKCRVEKAMQLLKTTHKSIENIMIECGFSNRTRFFSHFKEKTGTTPLKYRNMNKEKESEQRSI